MIATFCKSGGFVLYARVSLIANYNNEKASGFHKKNQCFQVVLAQKKFQQAQKDRALSSPVFEIMRSANYCTMPSSSTSKISVPLGGMMLPGGACSP